MKTSKLKNLIKKMDISELRYSQGYIIFNKTYTEAYYSQYASSETISLSLLPNFETTKRYLYKKIDELCNQ